MSFSTKWNPLNWVLVVAALAGPTGWGCGDDGGGTGTSTTEGGTDTGGDGDGWTVVDPMIEGGVLLAAWSAADEVIFVGGMLPTVTGDEPGGPGLILRLRDGALCRQSTPPPRTLWWIHGNSADDYFQVGEVGTIEHVRGGAVEDESVATEATLYGVWANDDGSALAVGGTVEAGTGEVWRRSPTGEWSLLQGDLPGELFKVWEDWLVGNGVAYQLEGETLVDRTPPGEPRLVTVRGRAADDVWAVGGSGSPVVVHWDGSAWSDVAVDPACAAQGLNGLWTAPGEDVWVGGLFGSVGGYDGTAWDCPERTPSMEHVHAVWGHGDGIYWAGGNLLSPGNNYGTILARSADGIGDDIVPCD